MQYHHIEIIVHTDTPAPYFTGAMLRGALGYALKKTTCINPAYRCHGCFAADKCLYYDFYERETLQPKFRLDVTLGSDRFDFGVYLLGAACMHLPYVLKSIVMALRQNGIGKDRITFEDIVIDVDGVRVYADQTFSTQLPSEPATYQSSDSTPDIKLKLLTPLRIKQNNRLEYTDIKLENIIRSVYQRKRQIFDDVQVHSLTHKPTYTTAIKLLEHRKLYRRSDRQNRKIVMDGAVGEFAVIGLDRESYELLKLGEIIGAGKQTTFGMGKIAVEEIKA